MKARRLPPRLHLGLGRPQQPAGLQLRPSVTNGTNNESSFLWENGDEQHAIPYTEIYIRAKSGTQADPGLLANDTDVDANDTLTVVDFDATSAYGAAVTVNPDGSYIYNPTGSAALQSLALGEWVNDTFTYTVSDGVVGSYPANGRFIMVQNNGTTSRRMDISEIEVFAFGVSPNNGTTVSSNDIAATFDGQRAASGFSQPHGTNTTGTVNGLDEGGAIWSSNGVGNFVIIDLGANFDIGPSVSTSATTAAARTRLQNFTVSVLADNGSGLPGDVVQSVSFPGQPATNGFAELTIPPLTELTSTATVTVTVHGTNDAPVANDDLGYAGDEDSIITVAAAEPAINLALASNGGIATQSTNPYGNGATPAIDGNTNGNWGAGSTTHSDNATFSWWQVPARTGEQHRPDRPLQPRRLLRRPPRPVPRLRLRWRPRCRRRRSLRLQPPGDPSIRAATSSSTSKASIPMCAETSSASPSIPPPPQAAPA